MFVYTCLLSVFLLLLSSPLHAQVSSLDPVKVAPRLYTLLFENGHTRVLDFHSKPGDKEPVHMHPPGVVYVLSGGRLLSFGVDGSSKEILYRTGDVVWREGETHSCQTIGKEEIHAIIIEFKESGSERPSR
jgi:quercetin dioxygenase-like cupin family protein